MPRSRYDEGIEIVLLDHAVEMDVTGELSELRIGPIDIRGCHRHLRERLSLRPHGQRVSHCLQFQQGSTHRFAHRITSPVS